MSEHDLGAYAPPTADAPLSFDARHPVRGARPFPVTLIISGLVLLGLVVAIFLFYRSGVREAGQPPKTIGTPVAEMKSPPPADSQPQDPAAGLQIYQTEGGQSQAQGQPNFVAPPEQPTARPESSPAASPPPQAAATNPVGAASALRPALPPAPPPAPPALQAAPQAPPKAARISPPSPPPAKAEHAKAPPAKPAPVKAAAAEPVKASTPAKSSHGVAAVQIGAVSSTALADKAWSEAVGLAPGLAVGKGKGVEKIDKDGHVLYRTAVTGFASKADAAAFCARLKAAGKACFVK
jgi:hypothetical protein